MFGYRNNAAMLPDGGDVCLLASDVFACRQKRCALTRRCVSSTRCDIATSQYHTATNPYFVNTSYASFLTSQSPQATIACLMLAYSFSPKVRKYLLGSPIFPTGTKVSRGVPDFSHGYKSIPRGPRFQCYKL